MNLLQMPCALQPISSSNAHELLRLQNAAFSTLVDTLRKLDPQVHRLFLVKALKILLDRPNLDQLPMASLTSLLFDQLDHCSEPMALLRMQNVFSYVAQALEGIL